MKVHTMLVIRKRDMDANAVSVRITAKETSARNRAPKSWPTFLLQSKHDAHRHSARQIRAEL
jgi:hypothetical protein